MPQVGEGPGRVIWMNTVRLFEFSHPQRVLNLSKLVIPQSSAVERMGVQRLVIGCQIGRIPPAGMGAPTSACGSVG